MFLCHSAKFNLLTQLTPHQPPLAQLTSNGIDFIILRENELAFIFCHSNASALFCQKLKDKFQAAFESVTRDQVSQQETGGLFHVKIARRFSNGIERLAMSFLLHLTIDSRKSK